MRLLFTLLSLFCGMCGAPAASAPPEPPRVAILVYHSVDQSQRPGTIDPAEFAAHLRMLRDEGYHILHPEAFEAYQEGWLQISRPAVLLTFDDGYATVYTEALPLLAQYQAPAMAFVITRYFGDRTDGATTRHLTREEARALVASGLVSLQSHSHDGHDPMYSDETESTMHPELLAPGYLPHWGRMETRAEYLRRISEDLRRSRQELQRVGMQPWQLTHFAPPFGAINGDLLAAARDAGFRFLYGTDEALAGRSHPLTMLPRINAGEPFVRAEDLRHQLRELFHTPADATAAG